jgi:hypothetical protein
MAGFLAAGSAGAGTPFEPGNLLLQPGRYDYFLELSPAGEEANWIWADRAHGSGDLAVAADGRVVFADLDGITTFDPLTGLVTSFDVPGARSIAAYAGYLFVGRYGGIARVHLAGAEPQVDLDLSDASDVNVGLDGLLYVAVDGRAETAIRVYDPLSLAPIRSVPLAGQPRAVAANAAGELFVLGVDGRIQRRSATGELVEELSTQVPTGEGDLDLSRDGRIAAIVGGGAQDWRLVLSDESLVRFVDAGHESHWPTGVAFYETESCRNGVDDDADGLADEADPEAACCGFASGDAALRVDDVKLQPGKAGSRIVIDVTMKGAEVDVAARELFLFLHDLRRDRHQGLSIASWLPEPRTRGWAFRQSRPTPYPGTLAVDRIRVTPGGRGKTRVRVTGDASEVRVPGPGRIGVSVGWRDAAGGDICAAAVRTLESWGRGVRYQRAR